MTAHYPEILDVPHTLADLPRASRKPGLYRNSTKRALDVALVLAGLPVILPVILILALIVMRDGHAPVLHPAPRRPRRQDLPLLETAHDGP